MEYACLTGLIDPETTTYQHGPLLTPPHRPKKRTKKGQGMIVRIRARETVVGYQACHSGHGDTIDGIFED